MSKMIVGAAILAAAVATAFVLVKAYAIILALFGAVVVGEAARPLVDRLGARVPRTLAVALVFAGVLAAIGFAWGIPIRALAPQVIAFFQSLPKYLADPRLHVLAGSSPNLSSIVPFAQDVLHAESNVVVLLSTLALVVLLAVFWLGSSDALRAFLLTLVQQNRRDELDSLFREMGSRMGTYVNGTIINGAIVAAGSVAVLVILRSPYPVVLGLMQGLLVAVPYVGTLIGVVTAGAVVLAAKGWPNAAAAIAALAVVATLEGSFIAPLVFKKSLNIDPLSTTLAIAISGALFGMGGVVLAVPAATVIQTIVVRVIAPAIRRNNAAPSSTA